MMKYNTFYQQLSCFITRITGSDSFQEVADKNECAM